MIFRRHVTLEGVHSRTRTDKQSTSHKNGTGDYPVIGDGLLPCLDVLELHKKGVKTLILCRACTETPDWVVKKDPGTEISRDGVLVRRNESARAVTDGGEDV